MADTQEEIVQLEPGVQLSEQKVSGGSSLWQRLALFWIMLISIFMNFFPLRQNDYGNLYYAAGVRSMLDNWHNFFYDRSLSQFLALDLNLNQPICMKGFGIW